MKVIIAGSTGRLATGLIRNALSNTAITKVIALGRREISVPTDLPPNANPAKLKSVVLKDFMAYDDAAKGELSFVDAVIWTIAITPSKIKTVGWEETCKISREFAIKGIETISELPRREGQRPLRFVYMSGVNAERDQTKKAWLLRDYGLMRGDAETKVLNFANKSQGRVEGCVAKIGLIIDPRTDSYFKSVGATVFGTVIGIGTVDIDVISVALLDQVVNGFEKETLVHTDVVRIGLKVVSEGKM